MIHNTIGWFYTANNKASGAEAGSSSSSSSSNSNHHNISDDDDELENGRGGPSTTRSVMSSTSMASGQLLFLVDDDEDDPEIQQLPNDPHDPDNSGVLILQPQPQCSPNVPASVQPDDPVCDGAEHGNHPRAAAQPVLSMVLCRFGGGGADLIEDDDISSISSRGHSVSMMMIPGSTTSPPHNNNNNNDTSNPILVSPSTLSIHNNNNNIHMSLGAQNLSPLTVGTPQQRPRASSPHTMTPRGIDICFATDHHDNDRPTPLSPLQQQQPPAAATTTSRCGSGTSTHSTTGHPLDHPPPPTLQREKQQQQQQRRRRHLQWFVVLLALLLAVGAIVLGSLCAGNHSCGSSSASSPSSDDDTPTDNNNDNNDDNIPITVRVTPYIFATTHQLYHAVDEYLQNPRQAQQYYGPLQQWNVSGLTNFSYVFASERQPATIGFNDPGVRAWDIRNARTLYAMFRGARSFAQDLCAWGPLLRPTANVTDLFVDTFCDSTEEPAFAPDETTGIYLRLEPWCVSSCLVGR